STCSIPCSMQRFARKRGRKSTANGTCDQAPDSKAVRHSATRTNLIRFRIPIRTTPIRNFDACSGFILFGRTKMARKAKKRKYSRSSGKDVQSEMRRYKKGTAKSGRGGKGGKVKSRKQAIAIGLSKARKKGKKVPKRKRH